MSGDRSKAWLKPIIIVMTSILAYVGCKSESMNKKQLKEKDKQ